MIRHLTFLLWFFCLAALVPSTLPAAEFVVKSEDKTPPAELAADIKAALQNKSIRISDGDKPLFEFWLRNDLPLSSKPGNPSKSLDALKSATLLGAVRLAADRRDYRDDELPAGLYTIRFGLQPSDGNHLGTAEFAYFAVLIPSKYDTRPDGIADYKAMVRASSKDTSTGHPLILSLRPVSDAVGNLPSLTEPAPMHKCVRVRIPGKAGETKSEVVFDLVFEGKAKE